MKEFIKFALLSVFLCPCYLLNQVLVVNLNVL